MICLTLQFQTKDGEQIVNACITKKLAIALRDRLTAILADSVHVVPGDDTEVKP